MWHIRTVAGVLVGTSVACMAAPAAQAADPTTMRSVGNFSGNRKQVEGIERPFFEGISKATGLPLTVTFSPMDALGVQGADALRHLRSGTFDVMSVQINLASRDDPFFDGVDPSGYPPMSEIYGRSLPPTERLSTSDFRNDLAPSC